MCRARSKNGEKKTQQKSMNVPGGKAFQRAPPTQSQAWAFSSFVGGRGCVQMGCRVSTRLRRRPRPRLWRWSPTAPTPTDQRRRQHHNGPRRLWPGVPGRSHPHGWRAASRGRLSRSRAANPSAAAWLEGAVWGWDFTWTLRDGAQVLEQHKFMECRFVSLKFSGTPPSNMSLSAWQTHYPYYPEDSSFTSSNATLNAVWELCRYTLEAASLDTYTDSNTRERRPYEADGIIAATGRLMIQRDFMWPRHSHALGDQQSDMARGVAADLTVPRVAGLHGDGAARPRPCVHGPDDTRTTSPLRSWTRCTPLRSWTRCTPLRSWTRCTPRPCVHGPDVHPCVHGPDVHLALAFMDQMYTLAFMDQMTIEMYTRTKIKYLDSTGQ